MKTIRGTQYRVSEWGMVSSTARRDPFNEIELDVVFTGDTGQAWKVPAYWAGGAEWRVRFAPPRPGHYRFESVCSDTSDTGLHGLTGALKAAPSAGPNPLLKHGPLRVSASGRHFEHADGKPFLWLGDTWWSGCTQRLDWPKGFAQLTDDRVKKGFNVIQIVLGPQADFDAATQAWHPLQANENGWAWEKKWVRINPSFYDSTDRKIEHLVEHGLMPCIVAMWGYYLPHMGLAKVKQHWRYLVARYGAYPVVWCLAGEAVMACYRSTSKEADRLLQKKGWNEMAVYVRQLDPYHRPITIHPGSSGRMELGPDPKHLLENSTHVLSSMAEGWRFKTDPDDCGETQAWYRAKIDSSWKPIGIAASWTEQGYDYHGAAWYDVECAVPPDIKNPAHLFFHAVDGTAKVWINGELAGEQSKSPDIMWARPWSLDLGKHLASRKTVRITVKVVKDHYACGIYKPVELREQNESQRPAGIANQSVSNVCDELIMENLGGDVLDFDMLQTGHSGYASYANSVRTMSLAVAQKPRMPVINGEVCYEGIMGSSWQETQRFLFWVNMLLGAAGHTYGAQGIWGMNSPQRPYVGATGSWGDGFWHEAMHYEGSKHVGLARKFLERYPWWEFEPIRDAAFPAYSFAAGIPKKVKIFYFPTGNTAPEFQGVQSRLIAYPLTIERGADYDAFFFNPRTGKEIRIGAVKPDKHGKWQVTKPWPALLKPTMEDWVLVLEDGKALKRGLVQQRVTLRGRDASPRRPRTARRAVPTEGVGRTARRAVPTL